MTTVACEDRLSVKQPVSAFQSQTMDSSRDTPCLIYRSSDYDVDISMTSVMCDLVELGSIFSTMIRFTAKSRAIHRDEALSLVT